MENQVTLNVLGRPLTFCMPPDVPVPTKGPCKGWKAKRQLPSLAPAPGSMGPKKKTATKKAVPKKAAPGKPKVVSAKDFEKTYPKGKRFYRGVKSAAGAAHTREGGLGSGDYGNAIYIDGRLATAQGYAGIGEDGRVMRMSLTPGTKIKKLPDRVSQRGGAAIEAWVQENDPDVFSDWLGMYHMVRNPAVLVVDDHDYTKRESVVLDYLNGGYAMPEGYQAEIERLRELLGIDIPDEGKV